MIEGRTRLYNIRLYFCGETADAIRVKHQPDDEAVWLPKSQIEYEMRSPSVVYVTAPEWLVIDKKLDVGVE